MADFSKSTTDEMIVVLNEYLKKRLIPDIPIITESIPNDEYDRYEQRYTRGIMVIPKDIFDVDSTIYQLVITGYHERLPKPSDHTRQFIPGIPASITTSTGDDDESPDRFFLTSKEGMIAKLGEILKVRTKESPEIPKNLAATLKRILDVLEMIEYNTQRPEWDKDSKWRHGIHETIPAPVPGVRQPQ